MEEKFNQEIPNNYSEKSMPIEDDYTMTENSILNNQNNQIETPEFLPKDAIDTAHLLISNSETSDLMPEMDKEIKLANLDQTEKFLVYQHTSIWNDINFLKQKQYKKMIEANSKYNDLYDNTGNDSIMIQIDAACEKKESDLFDSAGSFKKSRLIAALSRGKYGFERIQQIKTISEYKMESNDVTEKSPGFMNRFMGGFKR